MRKLIVLSVVLLLGLACNALADMNWDGGAGPCDKLWSTGLNWAGIFGDPDNTVPGPATTVNAIAVPGYGPTIANPGAVAGQVIVGEWNWPGELTVTPSGDLTDAGHLIIANDPGIQGDVSNEGAINVVGDIYIGCNGSGTLTNSGNIDTGNTVIIANNAGSTGVMTNTGDVNVDFWMYVGFNGDSGLLNMNGGTIDVPNGHFCIGTFWDGAMAGPGHVNFHGGTVTTLALTLNGGGNTTADFTEGVLLAANADADGIRWMAGQGLITAYGGTGTVMVDEYTINPGYITVWGVPPTDVYWDGGAGAGEPNWNVATNWNTDTVPTSANAVRAIAIQPWPGYGPVIANPGAVAKRVDLGILGWNGELTVTPSGSLTVVNAGGEGDGDLVVAYNDGLTGMLVNEGSIDVGGYMYIGLYGDGLLNMDDGTINVNGSFCIATLWDGTPTGIGHVNFNGGVVIAGGLISNGTGSCTADFTTGVLIAGGNHVDFINWLSSVNLWTAYGGWGDLNVDYNVTNPNKTTVTATNISHPAVELTWHRYSSVSRDWDRALNWWYPAIQHAVPRACDDVVISNQAVDLNSPIIEVGSSVDANYVNIGDDTFVSIATLTVAGGILDCDTLNIGTSGPAHLRLTAGTVTTVDLLVDITNATIDIEEGVLILDGDRTALINYIRDESVLTGYGDPDKVVYDYGQSNPSKTTVKAIPGRPCPIGDLSDDCVVNMEDLRVFAEQWLDTEGCSGTNCADLDDVNGVNFSDFAKMANNWLETPVALPRIAAESNQSDPVFYNTQTAQEFTPLGSNYIRLHWLNDDWVSDTAYHITFNTGFYDVVATEAALAQMQQGGYNIVRVFIDKGDLYHQQQGQYGMAGPYNTNTPELYQPCLDNLIDFLRRARSHNIYVILVCDFCPHNRYYNTLLSSNIPENVENINTFILAQCAIDAKKLYMTKLVEAVKNAEPYGALLSTVFSWEFTNEVHVSVEYKPFSMTTGTVTPADGLTYDMSDPDERQQCLDAGVIYWANHIVDAVKAVDPDAMASFSVFTYRGVGKSGPNGVLPRDAADPRFPPRPYMLLTYSTLSYVDVHMYPTGPGYPIDDDLASSEYSTWDLEAKPLLMGEFGAHKYYFYPQIDNVPAEMAAHRQNAFDRGFSGALYWTWNAFSQRAYWHLLDEGGMINDALKPGN